MDDQRKRFGYPDEEPEQNEKREEPSSPKESSYYYSYGPFRSISNDSDHSEERDSYRQMEPREVEVTPPEPVKQFPPTSLTRQTSGGGQGGGVIDNPNPGKSWNYSKKSKSSFKTVFLSFMAGVLVISGLMFAADRTNLFTPDEALSSQNDPQVSDVSPNNSGGATPASVTIPTDANDVASVVDQASPSVVLINTFVKSSNARSANPYTNDPFWYFFGGGRSGTESNESEGSGSDDSLRAQGIGSGFIFDKEGYILTNEHVIHGADVIQVTLQGNKKPYEAKLLGSSYDLDLAVLKIEGGDFPTVALGDSDALKVGEWLVAIGNPQGFDHTVTAGVLSSKERSIEIPGTNGEADRNYKNLLQTDASINPGNSGGPLLNLQGEVIGMNVAVSSQSQGIGFAIPSSTMKEAVDYLKSGKDVPKEPVPFIGAELGTVTSQIAQQLGTDVTEGSFVNSVVFGAPAYDADLRQYDIIVGVNGQKYPTHQDLIEFIQSQKVGDQITLNVIRNGKQIDLPLTIGDRNDFEQQTQRRR